MVTTNHGRNYKGFRLTINQFSYMLD